MLIVAMSEQFDKLKKKNSNILDNFDEEDIKGLIGVRNYIAHDYEGVNLAIIETDIRENMPKLKVIIEKIEIDNKSDFMQNKKYLNETLAKIDSDNAEFISEEDFCNNLDKKFS